jgi:ATP phosphoribosyltransferase regulatory subunit HisZ
MQIISASSDLHAAVKSLKQLDITTLQMRLNDRSFMNSLALSASEEQALTSAFQKKNGPKLEGDWA